MTDRGSLSGRTASGVAWMILGSGGQTVFQFIVFLVLARQIGPEAFGLIALAAVFIELSSVFGRMGLTEVVTQQRTLTEDDASTAFWSSFLIGLAFTVLLFFSAEPLAGVFEVPELKPVLQMLAPISLLYAAGAVYEGKLRREYGFRALAARNVTATICSGIVALVMALTGFGVYSLVAQRVIFVAWQLAAMSFSTRWLPSLVWETKIGRQQIRQGSSLSLAMALGTGNQRIIDLIVGYVLGPVALGYLRIAWRAIDLLQDLTIRPIVAVTLTSLSRLQDDRPALVAGYLRLVHMTALLCYPMFLGAAVVAPELVQFMFGPLWDPSVVPMQILTLTALFIPLFFFKSNVLMAVGAMRPLVAISALELVISGIVVLIASQFGLLWASAGIILRYLVIAPITLVFIRSHTSVPIARTLNAVVRPLIASVCMVALLLALKHPLPEMPSVLLIAVLGTCGALIYALFLWIIDRKSFDELFQAGHKLYTSRRRRPEVDAA